MGLDVRSVQAHVKQIHLRIGLDWTPADGGMDLIGLQPMAERPMAINSRSMHTVAIYGEDFIGLQPMGTRCHDSCTTDVMSLHKPMAACGWLHALHKFENRFRHRWVSVLACAGLEINSVARCTTDFRRERGKQ